MGLWPRARKVPFVACPREMNRVTPGLMPIDREQLARQLEGLTALDAIEEAHRQSVLDLLARPGDVSSRGHYEPGHLTASGFVLDPRRERLLLIHHGKLHRWLQPGGHVDPADVSLESAARREVREETSASALELLAGPFDVDVHLIPTRGDSPAHRHYDVRYLFVASDAAIESGSDALDARWVRLSEVHCLESDESVLRAVRKLQAFRASLR